MLAKPQHGRNTRFVPSAAVTAHHLPATPETCFWGYFDPDETPVLEIASGDSVTIEALTHHAGDAPDLMMDDGVRAVWAALTERGPGVHVMTGPISVTGAIRREAPSR